METAETSPLLPVGRRVYWKGLKVLFLVLSFCFLFLPSHFLSVPLSKTFYDPRLYLGLSFIFWALEFKGLNHFFEYLENKTNIRSFIFFILILHFLIHKFYSWESFSLSGADFSHYDYALWNTIHGKFLGLSIGESSLYYDNLLGNHFAPFLILLSPLVGIFQSHLILPFTQVLAAGLTFFFGRKLAFHYLRSIGFQFPIAGSFLLAMALIFNQHFLEVFSYEFHPEIFYVPFFLWFFLSWLEKSWVSFSLSVLLLFSIKQDAGIILSGVFVGLIFLRPKNWKPLLAASFGSLLIFFITSKWIMPFFHKPGISPLASSFMGMWKKYGSNLNEVILTMIKRPYLPIADILSSPSLYKALIPWLFLPLLHISFIGVIPLAVILFTSSGPLKTLALYYSAPLIPIIFHSTLKGAQGLFKKKYSFLLIFGLLLTNLFMGVGKYRNPIPLKHGGELRKELTTELRKLEHIKGPILITGNYLPQIPYNINYKRIYERNFYAKDNFKALVIGKTIHSFPFSIPETQSVVDSLRLRKDLKMTFENKDFIVFVRSE